MTSIRVRDVRVYELLPGDRGNRKSRLYPFDYLYCEIFRNVLGRSALDCKSFHHFYIYLSDSVKNARTMGTGPDWARVAWLAFDYEEFNKADLVRKEQLVFSIIKKGLLQIGKSQGLDVGKIRDACDFVEKNGIATVLERGQKDTRSLAVRIWWQIRPIGKLIPVFLNVRDKRTESSRDVLLAEVEDGDAINFLFSKVAVKKGEIWITANKSGWGRLFASNKPKVHIVDTQTFKMKKIRTWPPTSIKDDH